MLLKYGETLEGTVISRKAGFVFLLLTAVSPHLVCSLPSTQYVLNKYLVNKWEAKSLILLMDPVPNLFSCVGSILWTLK